MILPKILAVVGNEEAMQIVIGAGSRGAAAPLEIFWAPLGDFCPLLRLVSWTIFGTKKRF